MTITADVIRRGEAIPATAKHAMLADIIAKPADFKGGEPIVTEGVVEKSCWIAGCWMTIAPASGKPAMRVTFKKGAFAVPRFSGGKSARIYGNVLMQHGHAAFVAAGVELGR